MLTISVYVYVYAHVCMQALYGSVHLFFLSAVPDAVMDSLRGCSELLKRIKSFKEINLDFIVAEAETYHLDLGIARKSAYIVFVTSAALCCDEL